MKLFDSTTGESTWITPPELQMSLGHFDLDPCAADNMPYRTADVMVTKVQNGLSVDWSGKRVWLNPPYGKEIIPFLEKMENGIALLPCRTDNKWFHELVLPKAKSIFFLRGRVKFLSKDGRKTQSPAFASILVAYSQHDVNCIRHANVDGTFLFKEADE